MQSMIIERYNEILLIRLISRYSSNFLHKDLQQSVMLRYCGKQTLLVNFYDRLNEKERVS